MIFRIYHYQGHYLSLIFTIPTNKAKIHCPNFILTMDMFLRRYKTRYDGERPTPKNRQQIGPVARRIRRLHTKDICGMDTFEDKENIQSHSKSLNMNLAFSKSFQFVSGTSRLNVLAGNVQYQENTSLRTMGEYLSGHTFDQIGRHTRVYVMEGGLQQTTSVAEELLINDHMLF